MRKYFSKAQHPIPQRVTAKPEGHTFKRTVGVCPICQTKPATHADHNHQDGKSRDYLCRCCNAGLGMFYDNPEWLRRAALYLDKHAQPTQTKEDWVRSQYRTYHPRATAHSEH